VTIVNRIDRFGRGWTFVNARATSSITLTPAALSRAPL
jgi:hypothetical protein